MNTQSKQNDKQASVNGNANARPELTKTVLPKEAFEIEPLKVPSSDSVLVRFTMPELPESRGADRDGASYPVLASYATRLNQFATEVFKDAQAKAEPVLEKVAEFGETAGKRENEAEDKYYESTVNYTLPNGYKLTAPVAFVFGASAVAIVRVLLSGKVEIQKFKDLILSGALLRKTDEVGNFGKGDSALQTEHGQFLFGVRAVGLDNNGRLKQFYELLAKSAASILNGEELEALERLDHLSQRCGISKENLEVLVQSVVNCKVARDARIKAKKVLEKATEASQNAIATRTESEQLRKLETVRNANNGVMATTAH